MSPPSGLLRGLTELDLPDAHRARLCTRFERWEKLLERGVLVDLYITAWHPRMSIDRMALDRFGIVFSSPAEEQTYREAVKIGQLYLLPPEERLKPRRLDQRARALLASASCHMLLGYFVPEAQVADLLEGLDAIRQEYLDYAEHCIVGRLDDLKKQMTSQYETLFAGAYDRVQKMADPGVDRAPFIEEAVEAVLAAYPEPERIRQRYEFEITASFVPFQDQLQENELRRARLARETVQTDAYVRQVQTEAQTRIEQQVQAQAQGQLARLVDSLSYAERQIYEELAEACDNITEAISRNGRLPGATASQLKSMLDMVRSIQIGGVGTDDAPFEQAVARFEQQIQQFRSTTTPAERVDCLDAIEQAAGRLRTATNQMIENIPPAIGRRFRTPARVEDADAVAPPQPVVRRKSGTPDLPDRPPADPAPPRRIRRAP